VQSSVDGDRLHVDCVEDRQPVCKKWWSVGFFDLERKRRIVVGLVVVLWMRHEGTEVVLVLSDEGTRGWKQMAHVIVVFDTAFRGAESAMDSRARFEMSLEVEMDSVTGSSAMVESLAG
jgi:hypothetical protein